MNQQGGIMNSIVQMNNVVKDFNGILALSNISFEINPGEVHILLGENGAGKSTLMKILSGVYAPTSGEIIVKNQKFSRLTPKDAYDLGISIIYQELSVIDELSILENLYIGKLPTKKVFGLNVVDFKKMEEKAKSVLEQVGIHEKMSTLVGDLSISQKQQVEIAKALISNADVIIMDEPTTSLTTSETDNLFQIIRKLKAAGKGIVYISHKMKEIKEIGDVVTVLKDGSYVGTKNVKDVEIDDLVTMMVGREIKGHYHSEVPIEFNDDNVVFEVSNMSCQKGLVSDVSFKVHRGEIVGFAGLVGSGRSELMDLIFGSQPKKSGKIKYNGNEINVNNPYYAIKNGMAMVTENRRESGFMNNFDIKRNISIVPFIKKSRLQGLIGIIDSRLEKEMAEREIENLRIKCKDMDQNIVELSGGNQQKVILGKWLAADSELIILDEPTKGIDIGSKSDIYELIRRLSNSGKAIIVVSSELPELLSVCDTINVFREGKIIKTFDISEATEEKIIKASTGE